MKKIGFVTTNRVLAQSLAASVKEYPDLEFELFLLLNLKQAIIDAEVMRIDVAIIDLVEDALKDCEELALFCEMLRQSVPNCRIMLLVPQESKNDRSTAMNVVMKKAADDYVFYDVSLDYLLAKLLAL